MNVTVNRGQPQPVNRNEPGRRLTNSGEVFQIPTPCSFNVQNPYAERRGPRRNQRRQTENPKRSRKIRILSHFRFHRPHLDLRNKIVEVGKIVVMNSQTTQKQRPRSIQVHPPGPVRVNQQRSTNTQRQNPTGPPPKILSKPNTTENSTETTT